MHVELVDSVLTRTTCGGGEPHTKKRKNTEETVDRNSSHKQREERRRESWSSLDIHHTSSQSSFTSAVQNSIVLNFSPKIRSVYLNTY